MSLSVEYRPSSLPEAFLVERRPKQTIILNPRVLSFSEHTDFFREAFQSGPDSIFRAYNPSPTFTTESGGLYMAVRVDCGEMTKSVIFEHTARGLKPHAITFDLEDPLAENFGSEIAFGGVQVDKSFDNLGRVVSRWRTILYRGCDIPRLEPFFTGPEGMKDIRLHKRDDGKIDVYTRPRNPGNEALGGKGQIGYRVVESLDELAEADPSILDVRNAPLIPFRFKKGHWGGVNGVEDIKEGKYQGWNLLTIHDMTALRIQTTYWIIPQVFFFIIRKQAK